MPVPKIIHWIWLGGEIRPDSLANIYHTISCCPGFEFKLWTDRPVAIYRQLYKMDGLHNGITDQLQVLPVEDIFELLPPEVKHYKVLFKSAVGRECIGHYKNYASASDILRLIILFYQGGFYFDVDVYISPSLPKIAISELVNYQPRYGCAIMMLRQYQDSLNGFLAFPKNHDVPLFALDYILAAYASTAPDNLTWIKKRVLDEVIYEGQIVTNRAKYTHQVTGISNIQRAFARAGIREFFNMFKFHHFALKPSIILNLHGSSSWSKNLFPDLPRDLI